MKPVAANCRTDDTRKMNTAFTAGKNVVCCNQKATKVLCINRISSITAACFVVGGALVIFRLSRRSRAERISELSAQEQERLKALLDDNKRTLK